MKIFLGISGASGVNLGLKLAREIAKRSELHLCVSKNAMSVLEKELNFTDIFYKKGVTGLKFNANQNSAKFDKDREGAKFTNLDNCGFNDASWQICKSSDGEKNVSPNGEIASKFDDRKFQKQCGIDRNCIQKDAKQDEIYQIWQDLQNRAVIHDDYDLAAAPSSGSFGIDATIVAPCSINTLAKIHAGFADTLITRAAAVALKERKRLVLGVREMPFSTLALEHAAKLSALGAVIAPPVLGYYSAQNSLEDMENFIIGKWLDLLDIKHRIYQRWS